MKYMVPVGRVLFSLIFMMTIMSHFKQETIGYAQMHGVPLASVLVPLSAIIAFAGGLSISLGFKTKFGAWLIIIFLLPVTFCMHDFWKETDPMMMKMQMANFMKNISMLGAALLILWFGAGPVSIDERTKIPN